MTNEKKLSKIFSERDLEPRDYQIRNILDYLNPEKPHVFAAATAAGKTITSAGKLELLSQLGLLKEKDRVIIIPSDKTILRRNFIEQFRKFFAKKKASFTWCSVQDKVELKEAIINNIQVIIVLPQFIKDHLKHFKNIKWLFIDEAHKWYFASTIQRIIRETKPKHQFLLTGTPFKFNRLKNNFIIDYTSVSSLYSKGLIDDVNMQVLHSSVPLTRLDWVSMTDNLKGDKILTTKQINKTLNEVIIGLVEKLKLPIKGLSTTHNITKNIASKVFGKLEKTIIFTHRIDAANVVGEYLRLHGVKCLVSHYNVEDEIAEDTFDEFKTDNSIKVLVSVNRGKEGFDFPELYNIIDMTFSQNFEVVMQMIGRLLRKSNKKTYKVFYKVAPKNTSGYFTDWMDCLIQLFDDKWYSTHTGRNTMEIDVPNVFLTRTKGERQPTFIYNGKERFEISSGVSLTKGTKIQVIENNKKVPLKDGDYKVPQIPTRQNPNPDPIQIKVKDGIIEKSPVRNTRGIVRPKNLDNIGFDLSLSFMERNDWFKLEDPLSTVATTSLRKIMYKFTGGMRTNDRKKELYLPFEEARDFVRKLGLKNTNEWIAYTKSNNFPEFLPVSPNSVYNEFTTYGDFLGNGYVANRQRNYKSYKDAKVYMLTTNVKTAKEWQNYKKENDIPSDIPKDPYTVYSNTGEWEGWGDYLGTNVIASQNKNYRSYQEASKWAKKLKCKTVQEYRDYVKNNTIPDDIPIEPSSVYKRRGEWISWPDYLGY